MLPLPPRIADLADQLRVDLMTSVRGPVDVVLVDDAITSAIRLELHQLEKAAHDPNDLTWDLAQDRLMRRFLRCVEAVRYPRQRRPAPTRPSIDARPGTHAPHPATSHSVPKPAATARAASPARSDDRLQTQPNAAADHPRAADPEPPAHDQPATSNATLPDRPIRRPDPDRTRHLNRQQRRRLARQRDPARASPTN